MVSDGRLTVRLAGLIRFGALLGLVAAAGCSDPADRARPSGRSAESPAASAGPDLARGELLSLACQACHALTPVGGPDIGPSLYGIFGRPAASIPDFAYSDALREAGFIWTPERLDAWLQAPVAFLPGTSMAFAGYGDEHDRQSLIAWLASATAVSGQ